MNDFPLYRRLFDLKAPPMAALIVAGLSACTTIPRHAPMADGGAPVPYDYSRNVIGVNWDFSIMRSQRRAHGSDLWPCAWAIDGDLYCAWGDGGGFEGDSNTTGRVSLGFARIAGFPSLSDPSSLTGKNIWGDAPKYAEAAATFGGKVHSMTSVDGVLYAYSSLTLPESTPDAVHHSGTGTVHTLIWSTDLGKSWERAPWTNDQLGSFLNFGQNNTGALDSYVYTYYGRANESGGNVYLKRVPRTDMTADPGLVGAYEYLTGVDRKGAPVSWSRVESDAGPIFTDPAGVSVEVVYDAPIGRFLLTSGHNPKGTLAEDSAGKVGLFEGPHPWGPWATVGYYEDWGALGPDSFGDFLGLRFPAKWISDDGRTLWAVFSSLGEYDSFNLVKTTLTVAGSVPNLRAPAAGSVLAPGQRVTAYGSGRHLSWSVSRHPSAAFGSDARGVPPAEIATASGKSVTFSVPLDATPDDQVRVTLRGSAGEVFRDYAISVAGAGGVGGASPRRCGQTGAALERLKSVLSQLRSVRAN